MTKKTPELLDEAVCDTAATGMGEQSSKRGVWCGPVPARPDRLRQQPTRTRPPVEFVQRNTVATVSREQPTRQRSSHRHCSPRTVAVAQRSPQHRITRQRNSGSPQAQHTPGVLATGSTQACLPRRRGGRLNADSLLVSSLLRRNVSRATPSRLASSQSIHEEVQDRLEGGDQYGC